MKLFNIIRSAFLVLASSSISYSQVEEEEGVDVEKNDPIDSLPFGVGGYIFLAFYLILLIAIGIIGLRKKQENTMKDHYLAGDGLGFIVLLLTLFSSTFSGWTLLGMPGDAFSDGLTAMWWIVGWDGIFVGFLIVAPRTFHLSRTRTYITPGDFLTERFESIFLTITGSILQLFPTILYVLLQFKAMGHMVEGLSGGKIEAIYGAIFLAVIMLVYELCGGMRSVAWTDCIQAILLIFSFVTLYILQQSQYGGPSASFTFAKEHYPEKSAVPELDVKIKWVSIAMIMMSFPLYPHQMQRIFASKSCTDLKKSVSIMAFLPFFTTLGVLLIGWTAIPRWSLHITTSDQVFAYVAKDIMTSSDFGYWVVVILVTGVIAALMSTADSGLMAIASLVTMDYLANSPLKTKLDEKKLLIVAKITTIVTCGLLIVASGIDVNLTYLAQLQQQILIQVAPAFVLGLYWSKLDKLPVLIGMGFGTLLTIVLTLAGASTGGLHPGLIGFFVNTFLTVAIQYALFYQKAHPTVEMLNKEIIDEPMRHKWYFGWILIVVFLTSPIMRDSGAQESIVLGFPNWAFWSLMWSVVLSFSIGFGAFRYWKEGTSFQKNENEIELESDYHHFEEKDSSTTKFID